MIPLSTRVHLWLLRHRIGAAVLLFVLAACAVCVAPRIKLSQDFTSMLPMQNPKIAEQIRALRHIRQAEKIFIDVSTPTPNPEQLADAADQLFASLKSVPGVGEIRYRVDGTEIRGLFEEMQNRLPVLLSSNDWAQFEPRMGESAIRNRLLWFKKTMSQPQGMALKEIAQLDPVGLTDSISVRLRDLQAGFSDASIVAGRITSADQCHVLIAFAPAFSSSDLKKNELLISNVLKSIRNVEHSFPAGAIKIAVTGAHRMALENARMIESDATRTSIIAMVAVLGIMWIAFRTRRFAFLAFTPALFGAVAAIIIFYVRGDPVSAVALGCGSILIGITVDYGIYVIYHLDEAAAPRRRDHRARLVATLSPALCFGALTTIAAFAVMFLSPVEGHKQLGLFGAVGILSACAFAILFVPLFLRIQRTNRHETALPFTRAMSRIFDWRDRNTKWVIPVAIALSCICLAGAMRLQFEGDFSRLNGVTHQAAADEELIRRVWGKALSLTTIVVTGADREEALKNNERVFAKLAALKISNAIESFSSVAPFLPSHETQKENFSAWQAFWTAERKNGLSNVLFSTASELGFRTSAFTPFLQRVNIQSPDIGSFRASLPSGLLEEYCTQESARFFISTLVKVNDAKSFDFLRSTIKEAVPSAMIFNKSALARDITTIARHYLPLIAAVVVAIAAVLLFLLFGRVELVAITLLPIVAGVFWTLGLLGLFGIPINLSNFIFVIFVIGVGGDYSLFMVNAELAQIRGEAQRTATTAGAVTICALTSLFGIGALMLAKHPALFSVGVTALLGILLSLAATLFLLPPCLSWIRRSMRHQPGVNLSISDRRRAVNKLYRYQGPYVEQFVFWKQRIDPLFKAVDQVLPPEGKILDLGCGFGIVAHWLTLAHRDREVIGVDNDVKKISVAQVTAASNRRVSFENKNILLWETYPTCNHILLCDVLHYFPKQLKIKVLARSYQALCPGGCIVIRDACSRNTLGHQLVFWAEKVAVRLGQNRTAHGLHFISAEDHLHLLREAGFSRVEIKSGAGLGSNVLIIAWKQQDLAHLSQNLLSGTITAS